MDLREHTFDVANGVLNYADNHGRGDAVVPLHGLTSRWNALAPLIDARSPTYHVFACDLRGHGKSGHSPLKYPVSTHIQDVVRFITNRVGTPAIAKPTLRPASGLPGCKPC